MLTACSAWRPPKKSLLIPFILLSKSVFLFQTSRLIRSLPNVEPLNFEQGAKTWEYAQRKHTEPFSFSWNAFNNYISDQFCETFHSLFLSLLTSQKGPSGQPNGQTEHLIVMHSNKGWKWPSNTITAEVYTHTCRHTHLPQRCMCALCDDDRRLLFH